MHPPIGKSVISIIKQRKRLILQEQSFKNKTRCLHYISNLSLQIEAYGNKWNTEGWCAFVSRNIEAINYLVPGNKSGETLIKKIHEDIEHNGGRKTTGS